MKQHFCALTCLGAAWAGDGVAGCEMGLHIGTGKGTLLSKGIWSERSILQRGSVFI